MQLSEGLIAEFQKRHFEVFGEHISPETAEAELLDLAELVRITQPTTIKDIYGQSHGTEAIYTSSN
jgi:hypothetical protein